MTVMTEEAFKKLMADNWNKLAPSGTDFSEFTQEQRAALDNILAVMSPGEEPS